MVGQVIGGRGLENEEHDITNIVRKRIPCKGERICRRQVFSSKHNVYWRILGVSSREGVRDIIPELPRTDKPGFTLHLGDCPSQAEQEKRVVKIGQVVANYTRMLISVLPSRFEGKRGYYGNQRQFKFEALP